MQQSRGKVKQPKKIGSNNRQSKKGKGARHDKEGQGNNGQSTRGGTRSLSGGANIHIFVFTDLENNGFQKKLIRQNI